MAYLEKIKICGIRSFGPNEEDAQTINFQKPLTIILGENGCGKSTIIECLKYLTSQKEPAGKGTFVHDPNLTGKSTVKAFVKLQIKDAKENTIDLCRQVQATRTKKTLSTKTLDNVITRTKKDSKEKQSISNRCADFTYEISRIFGVSRAILENVIFCTQEDSHWPLDTDQKLKEKFDQIFDSDKYNKCVSKVREKVKKLKESIKLSDVEIKHLENNKKLAKDKRREIENTKRLIEKCEGETEELNSSLLPIEQKLKEINEKEMELSKNHSLKETKKMELKQVEDYIKELESRIGTGFEGTDEELKNAFTNFTKELVTRQKDISRLKDKVLEWDRQESKLSKELMMEQGKLGQLQKEEEINKERQFERNKKLNTLALQLDIDSSEMSQDSEEATDYLLSRVQTEMKSKEDYLKNTQQKYAKQEAELQMTIDKLREKSLSAQNEVSNKESIIRERKAEITKIKKELNDIETSMSKLSKVEKQLSTANKKIEELQSTTDTEKLRNEIQQIVNERDTTEGKLVEVEESIKVLQQNASISAELEVQRELLSNKESDTRRLLNKHRDSFKSILGYEPNSGFKAALQNQTDKLKKSVKKLSNNITLKEKELTELEMKRKHQKEQLKQTEEMLRKAEEEIEEECSGENYDDLVTSLKKQLDELQDIRGILSSSEFMYQKYIKALQKSQPCCPLCHRDFPRQSEAQELIEELNSKLEEVPSKLSENIETLEVKQGKYNKLLTLKSSYDQIVGLKTVKIPKMKTELETLESSVKKTRREIEDLNNQLLPFQTDEAICLSMQSDMVILDQLQSDIRKIGHETERLQSKLGDKQEGKIEDLFEEQDALRKRLKELRRTLENLQGQLSSHSEELQKQQALKNSLMEEMSKIQGGADRKRQLDKRCVELENMEETQTEELSRLKNEAAEASRRLSDVISKRNADKERNVVEVDKLATSLGNLQKKLQEINMASEAIEAYTKKGVGRKLVVVQKEIDKLESDISEGKAMRDKLAKTIEEIKRDLLDQERRERELGDNIKYREKIKFGETLKKEVAELERKYGNIDFNAMLKEKRKLKEQEDAIGKKKALIQGRMGELNVKIEDLKKELSGKMLKNIDADYNKELVKLTTMKAGAKDLEKYAATMDYAMMKYHKQKMTRVNAFIREYWMRIYQGNDIDYIEIQTDSIATSEKRRSYNYKLVQNKGGIELDMRNRCSAGQKMLASLIIRMALAETFSYNCGILTLDEPTTNLDRSNIKNLAMALGEVIAAKQNQVNGNFQLIVITHDEEFLRELMDVDVVSQYIRVYRNNNGKTRVSSEVFDGSLPRLGTDSPSEDMMDEILYD